MNSKMYIKLGTLLVGILILEGCQNDTTQKIESVTKNVTEVEQLKGKNIYSSVGLNDNIVLMAGENGMLLRNINIEEKDTNFKKQFKSAGSSFTIPTFNSYEQIEAKKMQKVSSSEKNLNENKSDKPKIYTMLKLKDGILVGGKFADENKIYLF